MQSPSLLALLLLPALASAATPQTFLASPRRDLAGDASVSVAAGDQTNVAIATGSHGSLIAFADRRAALSAHTAVDSLAQSSLDIWAVRLDPQGVPVDPLPFPLDIAAGDDVSPEVTWNGQNWLVTWVSRAPQGSIYSSSIVGVRVAPSGQKLDAAPIVLIDYPFSDVASYAASSDGANWVVVAQGTAGGSSDVVAARLSAAGVVIDPIPRTLMASTSLFAGMDLDCAQGTFLLAWSDWRSATGWDVLGTRFDSSIHVLGSPAFTLAGTAFDDVNADVASNGAEFLVGFERSLNSTGQADVQVVRATPAGQVLDPTPIAITGNLPYGNAMGVAVAWDGAQWFASWSYAELSFARIAASGGVIDFDGFSMAPSMPYGTRRGARMSRSASGGVQVAWNDARAGSYEGLDVWGARVFGSGSISPEIGLSTSAPAQLDVDLATDGVTTLAVYRSQGSGASRILASRLATDGAPLDPAPIEVATGPFVTAPSVAYTNGVWLITWSREDPAFGVPILARRMDASGNLIDPAPLAIGNGYTPEVAAHAGEFLIAWTRPSGFPEISLPYVARVRAADGAVLGPPLVINSNYARRPDVAVVGGRWFVVWQRNWSHDNPWADVAGVVVNLDGTLASTFASGAGPTSYNYLPRIASSGDQALIVWQSGPASGFARRVLGRRIDAAGTLLDPSGLAIGAGAGAQQLRPEVAFDGVQYVVAFEDTRATSGSMLDQRSDVYASRVTAAGAVLDPAGIPVETSDLPEHSPALVGIGAGRGLFAASALRTQMPWAAYRLGIRAFCSACAAPVTYCTSKVNSLGCTPTISAIGDPSASAAHGYVVSSVNLRNRKSGLLLYGDGGRASVPLGGGVLCIAGVVRRSVGLTSGGSPAPANDCSGVLALDMNAFRAGLMGGVPASFLSTPGTVIDAQFWARDPGFSAPNNVQLSNGLEFVVGP